MKNKLIFILLFLTSITTAYAKTDPNIPTYLFIQIAKAGVITYNAKKEVYKIYLYEVDPLVIYFSNAPQKKTSFISTKIFTKSFKESIQKHGGLNAGIVAIQSQDHQMVSYTVTLFNPQHNRSKKITSYEFKPLPGPKKTLIPYHIHFKHIALFIDGCADCSGSGF